MSDRAAAVSSTQSVLDSMTQSIVARKQEKATQLTPVGLEARQPRALGTTEASFPNDDPAEAIGQRVLILREQLDKIAAADAIIHAQYEAILQALAIVDEQLATGQPVVEDAGAKLKAKEAAGDAKARERDSEADYDAAVSTDLEASVAAVLVNMDAKALAAQAAVFGGPAAAASDGWVCPEHGKVVTKKSRKGRDYKACPDCDQFERL